ncbi:hypothetical protein PHLCEN_2v5545 [Hermanssonia centrifuga]|uniref:Uncharacterized protein n=1 Tax=Hermanssonia centrifuga TaxID=98765 RepID=A0A2R6P243_9APHY|nr:hypothetical protein PHLCEN_2v5545 [Hermanssonia centrifuga]
MECSPFARLGFLPFGGRSTAIKLSNGDVWVLASTPLNDETKSKIGEIGPVKYIIGADVEHHLYLADFKKQYPEAKVIAPEDVVKKKSKEGLVFEGAWGADPENTKYGFEDDIQHCYFSGFQNKDVAFFHRASKTLIEADLLLNLPPTEQYSKTKTSSRIPFLSNAIQPFGSLHKRLTWAIGVDKEAMKRDAKTVAGWDFERIIPCHGDVIEKNGKAAWMEAYKWYLE